MTPEDIQDDRIFIATCSDVEMFAVRARDGWSAALDEVQRLRGLCMKCSMDWEKTKTENNRLGAENDRLRGIVCKTTGGYDPVGVDDTSEPPGPGSDATS